MKDISLVCSLFLLFTSQLFSQYCTNDKRFTEAEFFTYNQVKSVTNITYGEAIDMSGKKVTLALDVYFPDTLVDNLAVLPTVIMIHGGGFSSGNKEQHKAECIAFAQRGFVAFTINYRLGWSSNVTNDQVYASYRANQDARAALRFIVSQHKKYHIDTNWMFIGGTSAGSITSHNVVYNTQAEWESLVPGISNKLGNLDNSKNLLTQTWKLKGVFNNCGAVFSNAFNKEDMIPEIAFHGELDNTVKIGYNPESGLAGSRTIHDTLIKNNICSELNVDPDGAHGVYRSTNGAIFRAARASCFFKSIFCKTCTNFYTTDSIAPTCSIDKVTNGLETLESEKVQFYPNPFTDKLNVNIAEEVSNYVLYSTLGSICYEGANLENIVYANLKAGNYVLKIVTREKVYNLSLQKE